LASFARLVGGGWQVVLASGATYDHTWQWGPGKYSLRKMTDASDAVDSWAGEVFYWHPGRKQVCMLSLHGDIPGVGRGVCEGTMKFEGETADGVADLYQPRGRRKLGSRWVFDGPDKYHDTLLEDTGAGLQPMNSWDFVRIKERPEARPRSAEDSLPTEPSPSTQPSKQLKVLEALLGRTWEAKGDSAAGNAVHIQSTYEWLPSVEAICARVIAPSKDGESTHLFDAYFYHHIGTDALHCLALSNSGGVYEGDLTVLDGGALQVELKGYEGEQGVSHVVRADFEKDGTLRSRVRSLKGTESTLMLDVHHTELDPK
jgi:hypothetical protein